METKVGNSISRVSFKIREMEVEDIPRIMDIENLSFSTPWSTESFLAFVNDAFSFSLVLQYQDEIAGYAMGWIVEDYAELANIAIDFNFRRMGLGEKLVARVLEICRGRNVSNVFLEVRESNRGAKSLYRKCGFQEIGHRKNYYRNPKEDALVFVLDL